MIVKKYTHMIDIRASEGLELVNGEIRTSRVSLPPDGDPSEWTEEPEETI